MTKTGARNASLAGRVTRFTGNILVTGLLVVVAIALGRQGLLLWSGSQPTPATQDVIGHSEIGAADATHQIVFGHGKKMIRERFAGDAAEAFERLRQLAAGVDSLAPWSTEPTVWEQRLLKSLEHQKPAATDVEQNIDYFEQPGPFLMSAAVARGDGTQAARIVSWGLATPATAAFSNESDARSWMLFVMAQPASDTHQLLAALTPPKAELVISLETSAGAISSVFRGEGDVDHWMERFRLQLEKTGAAKTTQPPNARHQCYIRHGERIDLFFSPQGGQTMIHMNVAVTNPKSLSN